MCQDDVELRPAAALARRIKQHKDDCSASEPSSECLLRQVGMIPCSWRAHQEPLDLFHAAAVRVAVTLMTLLNHPENRGL
jgi:hypothetical protein